MPFPVELLTTRAECDEALALASLELRSFKVNELVVDLRGDVRTEAAANRAEEVADLTAEIASLMVSIPTLRPGSTSLYQNQKLLERFTRRRNDLTAPAAPGSTSKPVAALTLALDVRQVEVQIPEIERFIAEVTAHRLTLPA